jgi:hypothetical protein
MNSLFWKWISLAQKENDCRADVSEPAADTATAQALLPILRATICFLSVLGSKDVYFLWSEKSLNREPPLRRRLSP